MIKIKLHLELFFKCAYLLHFWVFLGVYTACWLLLLRLETSFYWCYLKFILVLYLLLVLLLVHWPSWFQCLYWIIFFLLRGLGVCRVFLFSFSLHLYWKYTNILSLHVYFIVHCIDLVLALGLLRWSWVIIFSYRNDCMGIWKEIFALHVVAYPLFHD